MVRVDRGIVMVLPPTRAPLRQHMLLSDFAIQRRSGQMKPYEEGNQGTTLVRARMLVKEEEEYLTVSPLFMTILPVNEFESFEATGLFLTDYAKFRIRPLVEKIAVKIGRKARISGESPRSPVVL
jgi:hypothetical protein